MSEKELKQEQKKKIEFAKKLSEQSQSIKGTLAEKYLKEHRGIVMDNYPDDIRSHSGIYSKINGKTLPAMLVIARDKSGEIRAVQATYLDKSTAQKVDKSIASLQKQTFGLLKGATVNFNGEKSHPTLVAEGIETGLSLSHAIKNVSVKVTLSKANFKNIDSKTLSEKVIFCLDNDGQNVKSDKLIAESAKRLVDSNKHVFFMVPTTLSQSKQDYNDVLKHVGDGAIKRDFDGAISYNDMYGISKSIINDSLINHDKAARTILAHQANRLSKLPVISDKMIANFSKETTRRDHQADMKNIDAYRVITTHHEQGDVAKKMEKTKDFEVEI